MRSLLEYDIIRERMSVLGVLRKIIHGVAVLDSVLESFEQDRAHREYSKERLSADKLRKKNGFNDLSVDQRNATLQSNLNWFC